MGFRRGKKSLADYIIEKLEKEDWYPDGDRYLIVYSFRGKYPNPSFYNNLNRLTGLLKIEKRFRNVIICRGRMSAKGVVELIKRFGLDYEVYRLERVNL